MKWSITWTSSVEAEGQSLREQAERPSQHPPPLQERVLEKVWSFKADSFSILIYSLYAPLIFPGGGKASAYNAGDLGSNPGLGKSPGEGNGNPLQYSCLENPMDGGTWLGYSPWGRKESDTTERLHSWPINYIASMCSSTLELTKWWLGLKTAWICTNSFKSTDPAHIF